MELLNDEKSVYHLAPGYSPTAFFDNDGTISTDPLMQSNVPIRGTGGQILAVWSV